MVCTKSCVPLCFIWNAENCNLCTSIRQTLREFGGKGFLAKLRPVAMLVMSCPCIPYKKKLNIASTRWSETSAKKSTLGKWAKAIERKVFLLYSSRYEPKRICKQTPASSNDMKPFHIFHACVFRICCVHCANRQNVLNVVCHFNVSIEKLDGREKKILHRIIQSQDFLCMFLWP